MQVLVILTLLSCKDRLCWPPLHPGSSSVPTGPLRGTPTWTALSKGAMAAMAASGARCCPAACPEAEDRSHCHLLFSLLPCQAAIAPRPHNMCMSCEPQGGRQGSGGGGYDHRLQGYPRFVPCPSHAPPTLTAHTCDLAHCRGATKAALGEDGTADLQAISTVAAMRLERGIWTTPGAGEVQ